jgi:hypothetical protein
MWLYFTLVFIKLNWVSHFLKNKMIIYSDIKIYKNVNKNKNSFTDKVVNTKFKHKFHIWTWVKMSSLTLLVLWVGVN